MTSSDDKHVIPTHCLACVVFVVGFLLPACNLDFESESLPEDTRGLGDIVEDAVSDTRVPADTRDGSADTAPDSVRVDTRSADTAEDTADTTTRDMRDTRPQDTAVDTVDASDGQTVPPPDESPQGHGAATTGGAGGAVYVVTSLADTGAGTLREALTTTEARIIEFGVEGVIALQSPVDVSRGDVTIDGSTAPGAGVVIVYPKIWFAEGNVVLRHLRFRGTQLEGTEHEHDPLRFDAGPVLIDHCSFYWPADEAISLGTNLGGVNDATVQWSIFAEQLGDCTTGTCGGGTLVTFGNGERVSIHHNLMAHIRRSNPGLIRGAQAFEIVSNVIYDFETGAFFQTQGFQQTVDLVGNRFIRPRLQEVAEPPETEVDGDTAPISLYLADNIGPSRPDASEPDAAIATSGLQPQLVPDRIVQDSSVTVEDQALMPERVLDYVGATSPCRDLEDARIVADVRNGTGDFVTTLPVRATDPPQCASE